MGPEGLLVLLILFEGGCYVSILGSHLFSGGCLRAGPMRRV